MKKFLLLLLTFLAWSNAHEYTIYDMNGKNRGLFNGILNKNTLSKFTKEYHGSILVKKRAPNKGSLKSLGSNQLNMAQLNQIQKTIELSQDSLSEEKWIEVEKNEIVKICLDNKTPVWETSLKAAIFNDSCLVFQVPILIGSESINVYFPNTGSFHKINLAIEMKYLDFKSENVLLGYNRIKREYPEADTSWESDPERLVSVTGTYLVDKYPVTNCDFLQLMWDSIPAKATYNVKYISEVHKDWNSRKKTVVRNEHCVTHDTAASMVSLLQAMKYANVRSIKDGLKPYYHFSETEAEHEYILPDGYIVTYWDFNDHGTELFDKMSSFYLNDNVKVTIDSFSNGYRLPYYDEWMMLARGGDKKNTAPWGDSSTTFENVLKYAKLSTKEQKLKDTEPVGQLLPNGYGLYDIFGLVEERVLLKKYDKNNCCDISYIKGGGYRTTQNPGRHSDFTPYWKEINYGHSISGESLVSGFRLIRNIGNNAKWSEVKSDKE